jgi:hypothetical protein
MLAAGAVTTSAVVTLCALAATALILRVLPGKEAGRFAVLMELLYAIGLLGSLGQGTLQARLYQQATPGHFDWWRDLLSTITLTLPVILLVVIGLAIPYRLTNFEILFLGVGSELFVVTNCLSAVLAQQQQYAWSSAVLRLPNGFLILAVGAMLLQRSWLNLHFVLLSFLFFLLATALLSIWLLGRKLERGISTIAFRERLSGLVFLIAIIAIIATQRGMITVAGALLSAERVAALAALIVLLRVFDLIGEPAGRVFSTEMARHPRTLTFGVLTAPWLAAGILSAALLVLLPPLIRYFYVGRYDAAVPLLPWLVLAGALRFIEIVPRGFAFYLAPKRSLNWFVTVQSFIAAAGLALMVRWTQTHDLHGTAWAGALIAAVRVTASYIFFAQVRARSARGLEDLTVENLEITRQESPV